MRPISLILFFSILVSISNKSFGQAQSQSKGKITYEITTVTESSLRKVIGTAGDQMVVVTDGYYESNGKFTIDYSNNTISLSLLRPFGIEQIVDPIEQEGMSGEEKVLLTKNYKVTIKKGVKYSGIQLYFIHFLYNLDPSSNSYTKFLKLSAVGNENDLSFQSINSNSSSSENNKEIEADSEKEILKNYKANSEKLKGLVDKSKPVIVGCKDFIQFTTTDHWNGDYVFSLHYPENSSMPSSIKVRDYQLLMQFVSGYKSGQERVIADSFSTFTNVYIKDSEGHNIDLKYHNLYFIGSYDFNNDGINEILIGVRDEDYDNIDKMWDVNIEVHIFGLIKSTKSNEPFYYLDKIASLTGTGISGVPTAILEGNTIKIPRNHRGFFYGLKFEDGEFTDISNF